MDFLRPVFSLASWGVQFHSRKMIRMPAFGFWTTTITKSCLTCSRGSMVLMITTCLGNFFASQTQCCNMMGDCDDCCRLELNTVDCKIHLKLLCC